MELKMPWKMNFPCPREMPRKMNPACPWVMPKIITLSRAFLLSILLSVSLLLTGGCGAAAPLVLGGTVEAESADIVTEVAGRIESLQVEEGQAVARGDTAAVLDSSVQALSVTQLEQAVAAKQARLEELKNGSRTEQVEQARFAVESAKAQYEDLLKGPGAEQLKTLDAQVAVAQAAVDSAVVLADYTEQSLADAEALKKSGDLSDAAYKDAVYRRDAAKAARATAMKQLESARNQRDQVKAGASEELIAAAKARYEQAQAQLDLLENGTSATSIQAAEADLAQSQAVLEQSRLILDKYTLKVPCDGVISLLSISRGEVVNAGAAIGTVSDLKKLSVKLYIPQKNLSFIGLGTELDLVATSLPGKKIPARITWISDVAEFTPRNTETTASKETTVFRFKVSVEGTDSGLKPGMSLEAEIPNAVSEK
jgi:HlyD family secretion protein